MLWKKILAVFIISVTVISVLPARAAVPSSSFFSDNFEGYSQYGGDLYIKRWDAVMPGSTGASIRLEKDGDNGFAAFSVPPESSAAYIKKSHIDNSGRTLIYEGRFYQFHNGAKMTLIFGSDSGSMELLSLCGNSISMRGEDNLFMPLNAAPALKEWNKIACVVNAETSTVSVLLNQETIASEVHIDFSGMDMSDLWLKVAVSATESLTDARGLVYLDDFLIYEAGTQKERPQDPPKLYLNRQYTSIATNGRAHGAISFTSEAVIVDEPAKTNKSLKAVLKDDGVFFPLEQPANTKFAASVIYQSSDDVMLTGKNTQGHKEAYGVLPRQSDFGRADIEFDFINSRVVITTAEQVTEAKLTLSEIAYLGFEGPNTEFTLNKLLAREGNGPIDESWFVDWSYQPRAISLLVDENWKKSYAALQKGVFMSIDFYQASLFGNKMRFSNQPPRLFDGVPYVPAEESIVFLGGELLSSDETGIAFSVDGQTVELAAADLMTSKDTRYISAQSLADMFGLQLSWDGSYLLGFGTTALWGGDENVEALKSALYYARPSGEEIYDRIEKNGGMHPRVLADGERIAKLKADMKKYPFLKRWVDDLIKSADSYVEADAPFFNKTDNTRILNVSLDMQHGMTKLGIAWQLTGDEKYAAAAWEDLEAVSRFVSWNPTHYLDVATMSLAVGIGYSWFYDYLTEEQKDIIAAGYKRNALEPYLDAVDSDDWWCHSASNWNPWTHGGMFGGIVALSDRLGDDGKYALDRLFPYLEYLYSEFLPDGAWAEGTSYHATTLSCIAQWCSTMEFSTGKDYGYWDLPAMDVSNYYGNAISGAGGVFNYGDNTETRSNCAAQAWFAHKYNDKSLAQLRYASIVDYGFSVTESDILFTYPELLQGDSGNMEKDIYFSNLQVASMRTSWTDDRDGIFLAAKGGENGGSHFHFDCGGFVLDVGGVRFAYELGREAYGLSDKDVSQTMQYKKRAEGHNTYVINPDASPGQIYESKADITKFETKEKGSFAVVDLSQCYQEARSFQRGFFLTNNRRTLLIQDEVDLSAASDTYWFMHTKGDIELINGGKTALITNLGVTCRLDILDSDNAGAVFEVRDPLPLPTSPWLEGQGSNEDYKKLTIHWPSVQKFTLCVAVSQQLDPSLPVWQPEVKPIKDWEIEDGALIDKRPILDSITMNGVVLEDFKPEKYSYTVLLPYDMEEAPTFACSAPEGTEVQIIPSENMSGGTKFILHDQNGESAVYTVTTKPVGYFGPMPGGIEAEVVNVTASAEPEYASGNRAVCVLDDNYESRWTATGDAWIALELKEPVNVYAVGTAWFSGASRRYIYELEISENGTDWTEVYRGESSGETNELECIIVGDKPAKYVRYKGHGHTEGSWNNVTEMRVYMRAGNTDMGEPDMEEEEYEEINADPIEE